VMTMGRLARGEPWRVGRRGLLTVHVCGALPQLGAQCIASSLRGVADTCVVRDGGFSTMRLYEAAGCTAAEVPPPSAEELAAELAAVGGDASASGADGTPHCSAFAVRLADALLAAADAVEATPLADLLRTGDEESGTARLRAVVLPPGALLAGGDGDPALRWVPPLQPEEV
jgi:hypothetical protein